MIVTQKIEKMDLARPWILPALEVMQDDKYSRDLEFTLMENGKVWEIPTGTTAMIQFYKHGDGTGGNYTAIPDGTTAYTISGNVLTVKLAPQVCTVPGKVDLSVCLMNGSAQLHTFTIHLNVVRNPGLVTHSENYFKIAGSVADSGWEPNMYLGTGPDGKVMAVKAPAGGGSGGDGGYYTPIVIQTDDKTVGFWFSASQEGMPGVNPVFVTLPAGADGGYYMPYVTQPDSKTIEIGFGRSKPDMPEVQPVRVTLPGSDGGGNADLIGYATEKWVQDGYQPKGNYLTEVPEGYAKTEDIPTKAADIGALPDTYTPPDQTAQQVGADPVGTAENKVSAHNTDTASHEDIRLLIEGLTTRLNALANSTDEDLDQMAELVAYIKSNKSLIDSITTSKVSVTDIINNLTTNVANKPLSAAQGVVLKGLIDSLNTSLSGYQPKGDYALNSAIPTKVSQLQNDKGYLTEHQDISGLAAKFDPTVYGLPVLELTGDISPIRESKDNEVTLDYVYGDLSGTCTLKGQGATSYKTAQALGDMGKFNYTINFDQKFEASDGWGAQKKYCLKANFIDHSHSRNIVSAKLWGMIVKSRSTENTNLSGLVNGGAVDGFPIVIMLNGQFHGLYTFNIPKDGWMFGLEEDITKTQAFVSANDHSAATQFKGELAGDGSDLELEFASDEDNADWVTASLNTLINACINSLGGDLDDVVGQYLDWDSAIDYYIWIVVAKGTDMVDKNYLLTTFDGTKWCFTAYDMDSTYGLNWDGSGLSRAVSNVNFEECATTNRVYELIKRFKTNALKARYKTLRSNVLSETRIMQTFENFAWAIPSPVLLEDVKRWPAVPGSGVNGIDQIGRWLRQRLEKVDEWINALPAQETPVEPEEPEEPDIPAGGYTNLVPTSTDTDGSIYNGVGYKEDVRLSSSGGVSGTPQAGSVTTGFMPYTPNAIIRMKGATWLNNSESHLYYIMFYNSDKTLISSSFTVNANTYSTTYKMVVAYDDATGITTWDTSYGTEALLGLLASATYFRLNAYGKGADLIVTVNEEIT